MIGKTNAASGNKPSVRSQYVATGTSTNGSGGNTAVFSLSLTGLQPKQLYWIAVLPSDTREGLTGCSISSPDIEAGSSFTSSISSVQYFCSFIPLKSDITLTVRRTRTTGTQFSANGVYCVF